MSDPAEVLQWHESARERSDESFKALRKFELIERRPAPLNLSAAEVLSWIEEMQPVIEWQFGSGVSVFVSEIGRTFGKTLDKAVCLAAAKWKEANE